TASKKRRILESRVMSTRLMAERIAAADSPPDVLVVASGISFYGDTGNGKAGEASGKGSGFLADVVEAWEDAASPAVEVGVRVVHLRTGVVLGAGGGVLGKLVPLVRAGLGAIPGNGGQVVSWVALDDLVGIYEWVIQSDVSGPVNAVAPAPVSLENLTRALGHTLRRPVFARIPEVVLRRAMGEASGLLLDSQDVVPGKLLSAGYRFLCPTVDDALSWEIKGVPGNTSAKEAEEVVFGLGDSPSQRGELDGTPDAVQVRPALDEADDPPLQVPEDLPIANCARLDRGSAC
ncbi:MAG: TIGR01777 family protein, partial [Actinobacteria bacterium ATB1]|nr:TIGR01777 family protein [Actinobacteria bacterium ATB1]